MANSEFPTAESNERHSSPDPAAPTQALGAEDAASELATILEAYLTELEAGRRPDRARLLADHPLLASQLEQCLSGIEFIHRASVPQSTGGMPTQLGDFRIVREVGRGGMGVVYEAEQISLKRRVALKVLRYGAAADSEAMQRFQREAETVAGLHHTNIVPIFAIGCENGVNYYAMQFIEGRSLATVAESLRDSDPGHRVTGLLAPTGDIAGWGLQAAEALAHAHQRGVIHRDIKPSNLILDPDGRIWLTDFGLAKRMDDVSLSMAGAILGTPRYMSPEQAAAAKQPVDHRTDIYSLGATLYELATGRPLFEADSPHAVITQILTTEPPRPRVVCPDLPRDFETIILKCLAKEPAQRYATAQALADDLRAFVEGRAIRARRATLAEQAARWFKQQKRSVGIAATTVAATILVVIGSLIAWQMHSQAQLGYLTLETPRDGNERAEVAEVLTLNDEPVGSPFTLPTKEPLPLPAGPYRLRLTAPSKVSQDYLFDIAAGQQMKFDVGLVNETVGHALPLKSPVGVQTVSHESSLVAPRQESRASADVVRANDAQATKSADPAPGSPVAERQGYIEPRLFVGPQDLSNPTMRCFVSNAQLGWKPDGTRETEIAPLWQADWRLEAPGIVSFLKLPEDKEAWKVLPAQTDVFAWQQMLAWFDPSWWRNGTPPQVIQPMRDLNGDGIEDMIWSAPRLTNQQPGAFGPGPLTPLAAVLLAASGKDGQPLWWFRPQDSKGAACRLGTAAVWSGDAIIAVMRSIHDTDSRIEAVSPQTGESLWRHNAGTVGWSWLTTATIDGRPSVIAIIQDRVFALDAATGESKLGTPGYLDWSESGKIVVKPESSTGVHKGTVLLADVRFADLDADGVPEVLLSVFVEDRRVDVATLSLNRREALWQVSSSVNVGPNDPFQGSLPWPFVADLDADQRPEVIVPNHSGYQIRSWVGCRVLDGATGELRWERRFPIGRSGKNSYLKPDRYAIAPDLDGDGQHELIVASIRSEYGPRQVGQIAAHQYEEIFLYVDCFSGRDGRSLWWQRVPLGLTEYAAMTGEIGEMLWWGGDVTRRVSEGQSENSSARTARDSLADASGYMNGLRLVIPVHRHEDTRSDGGTHSIYVLSAATGRVEHQADDLAFPQLVDWNNDGLDDLAVIVPDDPVQFEQRHHYPDTPTGKFVVLRGSPPEAFRRLDHWAEEQDFDGDGIAELSRPDGGMGMDYAVQIASGCDGRIMSRWKTEWPETPRSFTVGEMHSFPPPLGDFDGDGLADLLLTRESHFWEWEHDSGRIVLDDGRVPLLMQAISSKTGRRAWGGPSLPLPEEFRPTKANNQQAFDAARNNRVQSTTTLAVDLDRDGRPELLQTLQLMGQRRLPQGSEFFEEPLQQQFVAQIDGGTGSLRWAEPFTEVLRGNGYWQNSSARVQVDASADLNGDGTLDVLLLVPRQTGDGSWTGDLQAHNGRDGKPLWEGPVLRTGTWFNTNAASLPQIGDLDGDDRPELVLLESKEPMVVKALRGDTGESLWTWNGALPPNFGDPSVVIVQSSPVAPRQESLTSNDADRTNNAQSTTNAASTLGNSSRGARGLRYVAVTINATGNQWELVLLDHAGKVIEKVPHASQLWSHDVDGDGGEELLRIGANKLIATRGLHDELWSWSPPPGQYPWVSRFDRSADGKVIVVTSSGDSLTLLDGPTGKPIGRSWRSTNTSIQQNNRTVDVNHANIATPFENSRLLTRVGDGPVMLNHVVSRAVLPTDEDGRYQSSPVVPQPESRTSADSQSSSAASKSLDRSAILSRSDRATLSDPRLVRQLMWALTPAEWQARRGGIFKDVLLAVGLSLIVVLTPYWLIRAGIRRRELGRWRIALIGGGITLFLVCLTLLRFPPPGANWRDVPWALPFAMSVGGLPILLYPATLFGALVNGNWRKVRWLILGTLVLTAILAAIQMGIDLSSKPPEQHYSWYGWWMIVAMGAYFTGGCLVLGHVFGPSVRWLWRRGFAKWRIRT